MWYSKEGQSKEGIDIVENVNLHLHFLHMRNIHIEVYELSTWQYAPPWLYIFGTLGGPTVLPSLTLFYL
jgi:hypothetical protein